VLPVAGGGGVSIGRAGGGGKERADGDDAEAGAEGVLRLWERAVL
jgi:hypothetical protein